MQSGLRSLAITLLFASTSINANAADFELTNNTNVEMSFAVIYKATVHDNNPPFNSSSVVSRGVGFWTVRPYSSKTVNLLRSGDIEQVWLYADQWDGGSRERIELERAQYSPQHKVIIAEIPNGHTLQTRRHGKFPSASAPYSGQLRVTPQHLGTALTQGNRKFRFYRTDVKGGRGTQKFTINRKLVKAPSGSLPFEIVPSKGNK